MRTLKRSMLGRIIARLKANRQDYLDWLSIPRPYDFVAIDELDSRDHTGRVIFEAGRPVAYSDPVHFESGRWVFKAQKPGDMPTKAPAYVAAAAIIGPLPKPKESLRIRPGRTTK
jgi:hypothetical protein